MAAVGVIVTLLGFLISIASLGFASSVTARLIIVVGGIVISLFGIVGVLNRHYLANAIWRK
jgi:hypothetical protein